MTLRTMSDNEAANFYARPECARIKRYREEAGWSVERCAKLLGLSPGYLDLIEHQAIGFTPTSWYWLSDMATRIIELDYAEKRLAKVDGPRDGEATRLRSVIERAQAILDEA